MVKITNFGKSKKTIEKTLSKLGYTYDSWVFLGKVKQPQCEVLQYNYVTAGETITFNTDNDTSDIISIEYDNGFVTINSKNFNDILSETKHYNSHK